MLDMHMVYLMSSVMKKDSCDRVCTLLYRTTATVFELRLRYCKTHGDPIGSAEVPSGDRPGDDRYGGYGGLYEVSLCGGELIRRLRRGSPSCDGRVRTASTQESFGRHYTLSNAALHG